MRRFILIAALLFTASHAGADPAKMVPNNNLTILADDDMMLPLAQLARAYSLDTKTPLTIVMKNADEVQAQIEQGLEAHIIVTANYPLMSRLTDQGLIDVSSRKPVARTQLALVTVGDLGKEATIAKRISFASMVYATPEMPIYIDVPTTIEGARTATLLTNHEFSKVLAARAETKPSHDELIASLHDTTSLGIILAANAVMEPEVRVLSLLPDDISPPVQFDSAVLGSEAMSDAKRFNDYLSTAKARAIFAHFGYQPPLTK